MKKIIHLLPNAHLDPVWLWDRSEGLNEGIRTCRALVRLLEEFPEMVFNRGEAAIYHHIETFDPELWEHILDLVNAGRWECVGGNWVQTDHNMPSTESLFRHYREGQQYFREKFGRPAVTAWAPDSFGHSAGIPDLLAANGFQYFSFMRPQKLELPGDLFRWSGPGGGTLLAYRLLSYTAERDVAPGLDRLAAYQTERNGRNIGIGFGLGDHGGGTSRGQIEGALAWAAAHPEFEVRFSTFRSFFTALEDEIASGRELPEFQGELNYCLRGCYSSVPRFKRLYRQAESALLRAERTVETVTPPTHAPSPDLKPLWKMLFFNSFHDILPGSAIERALEQQSCQLCAVIDGAFEAETAALNRLAAAVEMPVPAAPAADWPEPVPLLVFNPLPRPFHGLIELEESLDYRPIYRFRREDPVVELRDDAGNLLPAQEIPEEHNAMKHCVAQTAARAGGTAADRLEGADLRNRYPTRALPGSRRNSGGGLRGKRNPQPTLANHRNCRRRFAVADERGGDASAALLRPLSRPVRLLGRHVRRAGIDPSAGVAGGVEDSRQPDRRIRSSARRHLVPHRRGRLPSGTDAPSCHGFAGDRSGTARLLSGSRLSSLPPAAAGGTASLRRSGRRGGASHGRAVPGGGLGEAPLSGRGEFRVRRGRRLRIRQRGGLLPLRRRPPDALRRR